MPSTIEELEAAIQDNLEKARTMSLLNQNVLAECEIRQKKIEALEKTLGEEEQGLSNLLAEIDSLKASWLPTLQNLVSQINGTFGRNIHEMAVAGEVSLDEHGMEFGVYGIVIKVKFRTTLEDLPYIPKESWMRFASNMGEVLQAKFLIVRS